MILIKPQIMKAIADGDIVIEPFDESKMNTNSYNLTLADEIAWYKPANEFVEHRIRQGMTCSETVRTNILDMKTKHELEIIKISEKGFVLEPNRIYLARTNELTKTLKHVPMLEGRSSVGRLGLFIHATAGFGDVGFEGYWTLELSCVQPVRIYPNVDICQIYYHSVDSLAFYGENGIDECVYKGKYQSNKGIQGSKLYEDFEKTP